VSANIVAIAVAGAASVVFRVTGRWHCERVSANHGRLTPAPLLVVGRMSLNGARFFRHAVRITRPRGAYAPRSWLYMRLCIAKVAISPAHVRACKQERRASARRGFGKCICDGDTTHTFCGRLSRDERAAGVSPPWVAETHLQGRYRKHAGDCRRCAGERRCNRGRPTTGGDASRSCVARMCFCWRFAVSATRALPNHGGLTPPALVACSASVCRQNCDFCDVRTQLRQERRA
jgi:hypothetical protein